MRNLPAGISAQRLSPKKGASDKFQIMHPDHVAKGARSPCSVFTAPACGSRKAVLALCPHFQDH